MTELFGIPMSTIVLALAAMLVVSLLSVAWVYMRRRVIFRLGARNIPRRKAQTALIVFGLMLSTLIVTAALGTGDTVNGSMTSEVYAQLGPIDQFVADRADEDAGRQQLYRHHSRYPPGPSSSPPSTASSRSMARAPCWNGGFPRAS